MAYRRILVPDTTLATMKIRGAMYSFSSRVRYSECDDQARLSLVSLINYLQDCSTFQTESLGLGLGFLAERHFAWLLAAWQIEILERPRFCDPIEVRSWCYGMTRTFAQRNFQIVRPDGTPYVNADSLWFTFDTEAGRPCRIPESEQAYLMGEERLPMPPTERKLKTEGPYVEGDPIIVSTQHLDTNRHVNNAQYVLMAAEALPDDLDPRRICVQYRLQAHQGDVLIPRIRTIDDVHTVELVFEDGTSCAVVRMEA